MLLEEEVIEAEYMNLDEDLEDTVKRIAVHLPKEGVALKCDKLILYESIPRTEPFPKRKVLLDYYQREATLDARALSFMKLVLFVCVSAGVLVTTGLLLLYNPYLAVWTDLFYLLVVILAGVGVALTPINK